MDTKDNATRIGLVTIKLVTDKFQPRLNPKNRLLNFLNTDPNDKQAVMKYCSVYSFLPRDLTKGWQKGFETEWLMIKTVFDKALNNALSNNDIKDINDQLESISNRVKQISESDLIKINSLIDKNEDVDGLYNQLSGKGKNQYLIQTKTHKNSAVSLWEDLLKLIQSKQKIKNCAECGLFFVPDKYTPRQKFCSEYCKDRYHKRKKKLSV